MNPHEVPSTDIMNAQDSRKDIQNQIPHSIIYEIEKAAQFFLPLKNIFKSNTIRLL